MSDAIVETSSGRARGADIGSGVLQFLAIPFTGPFGPGNRFRAPSPPRAWTGVRDAVVMPHPVPQIPDAGGASHTHLWSDYYPIPPSEDGLALNLWTPGPGGETGLPVMIWLHGGGFAAGQ